LGAPSCTRGLKVYLLIARAAVLLRKMEVHALHAGSTGMQARTGTF
jgi:hypothetical protein